MPYKDPKEAAAQRKRWAAANPEKVRESTKAAAKRYTERHPERVREASRRWFRKDSNARWQHIKARFGMSRDQWFALFEFQGCVCAICGCADPRSKKGWNTDHDHSIEHVLPKGRGRGIRRATDDIAWQMTVRGILCQPCNIGLGGFDDDPARMRTAATYVERGPLARPRVYLDGLTAGLLF